MYYDLPKPSFTPGICRSSKPHNSQSEAANKISDLLCSSSAMVLWKCPADPLLSYPLPPLLHHSHSSVGLTHLWEVPGVTWWPRSSAVMLINIWQVLITKQMRRMQNLWSEPLCDSSPRRCEVLCSAGWDVTAPSKMLSNTSLHFYCQCFSWSACQSLKSVLKSVWTQKQKSKEWEYHIVALWSNRFYVPMEMTYVCISSHCLKLVSGASLWLMHLLLYTPLTKSASFPSLRRASCSHSLQACTYSRTNRHWGMFWIRIEYAFPWMLWIILKIFIFANCLCAFWPLT